MLESDFIREAKCFQFDRRIPPIFSRTNLLLKKPICTFQIYFTKNFFHFGRRILHRLSRKKKKKKKLFSKLLHFFISLEIFTLHKLFYVTW